MSRNQKLIAAIRNNPRDVRFDDALRAAELIGFTAAGGSGSHRAFARPGEAMQLNFQEAKGGKAKPYQVRQLIEMIERYWGDDSDDDVESDSDE